MLLVLRRALKHLSFSNNVDMGSTKCRVQYYQRFDLSGELLNVYNEETLAAANYKRCSVVAASNNNYVNGGRKTNIYKNSTWRVVKYEDK